MWVFTINILTLILLWLWLSITLCCSCSQITQSSNLSSLLWCHSFIPAVSLNFTRDSLILVSFLIIDRYQWLQYWCPSKSDVSGKTAMKFNGCSSVLSLIICLKKFCIKNYQTGIICMPVWYSNGPRNSLIFFHTYFFIYSVYIFQHISISSQSQNLLTYIGPAGYS